MGTGFSLPQEAVIGALAMAHEPAPRDPRVVFLPYNALEPKIRKARRPTRHALRPAVPRPISISARADNRWVMTYGEKRVEAVYLCDTGGAWLLFEDGKGMGLIALHPHPPMYGVINYGELDALCENYPSLFGKAFTQQLPCTLSELFENTTAWAYFE